ncbi:MAG: EcsC family protein [Nevskia sp.]
MRPAPTPYEREQLRRIRAWRDEAPNLATRSLGHLAAPAASTVQRLVPTSALAAALQAVQTAGTRSAARKALLKRAGVGELAELQAVALETCDRLSAHVRQRGMALAGGSGALFGIAGGFGLVADVPSLLVQTFRVIHRVGLCYGEDCALAGERRLPVAVFALASANSADEKQAALAAIEQAGMQSAPAWRDGLERAAERELAKEAAVFSLANLAKTISKRLGLRKAAGGVPVFGALVGGAVNAWYLNDVATAAERTFQLRWLLRKYGAEINMAALAAPVSAEDA